MASDRDALISSSLQLGNSASRADTWGRRDGLRAGAAPAAVQVEQAAPAATGMPALVMSVAIYEFCRAIIVGAVFALTATNPEQLGSRTLWQIYFVVSNGMLRVSPFTLVSCCYGLAIGLALFFRVNWGRRILIGTSIYSVLRLARFLAMYSTLSARLSSDPLGAAGIEFLRNSVYILVAVNVAIGLCMACGPGVGEWFNKRA